MKDETAVLEVDGRIRSCQRQEVASGEEVILLKLEGAEDKYRTGRVALLGSISENGLERHVRIGRWVRFEGHPEQPFRTPGAVFWGRPWTDHGLPMSPPAEVFGRGVDPDSVQSDGDPTVYIETVFDTPELGRQEEVWTRVAVYEVVSRDPLPKEESA